MSSKASSSSIFRCTSSPGASAISSCSVSFCMVLMGTKESAFTHLAASFFSMLSGDTSKSAAKRSTDAECFLSPSTALSGRPSVSEVSSVCASVFTVPSAVISITSALPSDNTSSPASAALSIFPGTSPTEDPVPFPARSLPFRSTISPLAASSLVTLTLSVAVRSGKIKPSSQTSTYGYPSSSFSSLFFRNTALLENDISPAAVSILVS